jgi:uncharacterized membrane protein YfcA
VPARWLAGALVFAAAVAAAVAALLFFIGIFGDEGLGAWGWVVAIALAAGAVAALVWGARISRRRRY